MQSKSVRGDDGVEVRGSRRQGRAPVGLSSLRQALLSGAALGALSLMLAAPAYAVDGVTVVEHYITTSQSFTIDSPNPIVATGNGAKGILVDGDVGSVDVTVERTGDVQSGKDDAIYLHTSGDISLTSTGVMDGYTYGIGLASYEDGNIVLDQTGNVNSRTDIAVFATGPGNVDLSVDGNVDGYLDAVHANSFGNSLLSVDVTGTVDSRIAKGIYAKSGGAITINVGGDIDALLDAVYADSFSYGQVTIDLSDDVLSRTGNGLYAYTGGAIDIDVDGKIDAYLDGVYANSYGSSLVDIDVLDNITARTGKGVYAYSGGGIDVFVDGNVDAEDDGLYGNGFGSGTVTLKATGNVTSRTARGVYANAAGTITVDVGGNIRATQAAIYANGYGGSTNINVKVGGSVQSDNSYAVYANSAGVITVDTKALTSDYDAIYANSYGSGGGVDIDVVGDVTSWTGKGISVQSNRGIDIDVTGNIKGNTDGVHANSYGSDAGISIDVGGAITAETGDGINAYAAFGSVGITTVGPITARLDAIYATSSGSTDGTVTINSTGALRGWEGYGIYGQSDYHGVQVTSVGNIGSYSDGIFAQAVGNNSDALATVVSQGNITSDRGRGIFAESMYQRATVFSRGDIIGKTDGIYAHSAGNNPSGYVEVNSAGDIDAYDGMGIYALSNEGRVYVTNAGDIVAKKEGIFARTYGDDASAVLAIWQDGDILSYDRYGIFAEGSHEAVGVDMVGDIDSRLTGIYAHSLGAEITSATNVFAKGDIISRIGYGIDALSTFGNVWVSYDGTMDAKMDGIHAVSNANTLDGRVRIGQSGYINTYDGYAIYGYATEGGVTILSSNSDLHGKMGGIYAKASGDVDDATVDVYTDGDIFTWDGAGIYAESTSETVKVDAGGGTISGGQYGIQAVTLTRTSDVTLRADGIISGTNSAAVLLKSNDGATLTNHGQIDGGVGLALLTQGFDGTTVNNDGSITGSVQFSAGKATFNNQTEGLFNVKQLTSFSGAKINNAGTISPGGSGTIRNSWVEADLKQTSTGTLLIDVDGTTADQVQLQGNAELDGYLKLNFVSMLQPTTVTVLTSYWLDERSLELASLVLDADIRYVADTDVVVDIIGFDFSPLGLNGKQAAIGDALTDGYENGKHDIDPLLIALANLGTVDEYEDAMNQLSPEVYADQGAAAVLSNAIFANRLLSCKVYEGDYVYSAEGQCVWLSVGGDRLDQAETTDALGYTQTSANIAAGGQIALSADWYVGGALGYTQSSATNSAGASSDGDLFEAGAVVKYDHENLVLAAALTAGHGMTDTTRLVDFGGFTDELTGNGTTDFVSARLRAAYTYELGSMYMRPQVDLDLTQLRFGGFTEAGGVAALEIEDGTALVASLLPALEFGGQFDIAEGMVARPYVRVGAGISNGGDMEVTARFDGGSDQTFAIASGIDSVVAKLGAGVDVVTSDNLSMRLYYEGSFGENTTQNGVGVKFAAPF